MNTEQIIGVIFGIILIIWVFWFSFIREQDWDDY